MTERRTYVDMNGTEYLLYLRGKQDMMQEEILRFCKSYKKCAVSANRIYEEMKDRYPMSVENKGEENVILRGVLCNLLMKLVSKGMLEVITQKDGDKYRISAACNAETEAA